MLKQLMIENYNINQFDKMNQDVKMKFKEASQYADRGQNYDKEGNYQYSSKCYLKVAKILGTIVNVSNSEKTTNDLRQKIKKYTDLAGQMLDKQRSKQTKKVKVSKFGFPQTISFLQKPEVVKKQQVNRVSFDVSQERKPNRNTCQVDSDIEGLICRDIKFSFKDIIGMEQIKDILYEAVIFPQKRPDLFQGIRSPPKGLLLYGPPGNGKTFIVKALAKQSGCVFYGLSAGSIVNKFVGQSEKMLKKIFISAKRTKPSIIFIDQIDSIITARSQNQNQSSRRLKTQFLIQFDSIQSNDQVILVGATNFPGELDLAALRRFNKLVYIGLPQKVARQGIVISNLSKISSDISKKDMIKLVKMLEGYTVSEITDIVKEASMMPIREIKKNMIDTVVKNTIRAVKYEDFEEVIKNKKPLLTKEDIKKFQGKFR